MAERVERNGLKVDRELVDFVEAEALPETGIEADTFWAALATLAHDFGPRNQALLDKRDTIQGQIDDWHLRHRNQPHDHEAYKAFLREIGYLLPVGGDFEIETADTDPEIASIPGPQLVVPITNARYALNAANARWGSLYDALYGTDAVDAGAPSKGYDRGRGGRECRPSSGPHGFLPARAAGPPEA